MYNKQLDYEKSIALKIAALNETPNHKELEATIKFHETKVAEAQHERFIHLVITLFFGFLLLVAVAGYFVMLSLALIGLLPWLSLALVVILFMTELFYIGHYYKLENGTQRLYQYTDQLYDLQLK